MGDANAAAAAVIGYLDGNRPARGGRAPGHKPDLPRPDGNDGLAGYYADSVEGPGTWMGRGLTGLRLSGEVDSDQLQRLLVGKDPFTGEVLLGPAGSAVRAEQAGRARAEVARRGDPTELLTLPQAAALVGVSARYLRRVATRTEQLRAEQLRQITAGEQLSEPHGVHLDAVHSGCNGRWQVTRAEVARFIADRKPPTAVVGYDVTFSAPKSVSILWAAASPPQQAEILASLDAAVAAGVTYLEDHAAFVQASRFSGSPSRTKATGLVAASYLHATSRALDPQLHRHVVIANMAERPDGVVRALDGRPLFAHSKTAGYLAAAELRHQLSTRLGVEWNPIERGVADVAGVPEAAIAEMSKRSSDIDKLTASLGLDSATARQMAAYATRAEKGHGVDPAALRPHWGAQLADVGFDPEMAGACYERQATPPLVTDEDRQALSAQLGSAQGITEMSSVFDRRDVVQHVAEWAGDRLDAPDICDLADEWLVADNVVRLEAGAGDPRRGDVICRSDGRVVSAVGEDELCTTRDILDLESAIVSGYAHGRDAGVGVVPADVLDATVAARHYLSQEQIEMVAAVTQSGMRTQCVLGSAGSGKTTALEVAARVWEAAGYRPVGVAVQGTAAELLGSATGMPCSTVASLLARLDQGVGDPIGPRTVVVVDEASTLGNRDLARLQRYVIERDAALRLVGDPAQHSAVPAGGAFRHLVEQYPADTPVLSELRRQRGAEMADVRLALTEYREGHIAAALERLRTNDRVVQAQTADELLDAAVADWYVDRSRRKVDPSLAPSTMVADHHFERRELNLRARAMLVAAGDLTGTALEIGGVSYQAGDEVIALTQDRQLRSRGIDGPSQVRTGERGRVVEVRDAAPGEKPSLVVDFDRRGQVEVPYSSLVNRVRPGVTGSIAHSYALTSYAAQGETYEAGRHLATDASSRPGVYIGLSRGRSDARLYVVRRDDLVPSPDDHPSMPRLDSERTTLQAMANRLRTDPIERLAHELDPVAEEVVAMRREHSLDQLDHLTHSQVPPAAALARRALHDELNAVAERARLHPEPSVVARLGARPDGGPNREAWDNAVGSLAVYNARWGSEPSSGPDPCWALGRPPAHDGAKEYWKAAAELRRAEVVRAASRPTADLAAERHELVRVLATAPSEDQYRRAIDARDQATKHLDHARNDLASAEDRFSGLQDEPRWRRNRQGIELARRGVNRASQAVADAELGLQRSQDQYVVVIANADDARPVKERLELMEDALGIQVDSALERPAEYLYDALGTRPETTRGQRRWDASARQLERYRHAELGLDPTDGPLGDHGLEAAIGSCPDDELAEIRWEDARARVREPVSVTLEMEGPGIEL